MYFYGFLDYENQESMVGRALVDHISNEDNQLSVWCGELVHILKKHSNGVWQVYTNKGQVKKIVLKYAMYLFTLWICRLQYNLMCQQWPAYIYAKLERYIILYNIRYTIYILLLTFKKYHRIFAQTKNKQMKIWVNAKRGHLFVICLCYMRLFFCANSRVKTFISTCIENLLLFWCFPRKIYHWWNISLRFKGYI